jgi:class 3 adenylate cyclase
VRHARELPDPDKDPDPLQYRNRLRFPPELERRYREDHAARTIRLQRHFIAFGATLYGLFAILDTFAMPRTHQAAWLLRAGLEPFFAALFFATYQPAFQKRMHWLINLLMMATSLSILGMIVLSQPGELAYTFYPIGVMLVAICGYIASGHLGYASLQGWLAVLGYILVGVIDQRMTDAPATALQFFTLNFFLVGLNLIGMMLAYTLERTNRLAFLQRLVIEGQHKEAEKLRAESERLLLNVLPASIAERLKHGEAVADHFEEASILFADIADFTPYSASRSPAEVVSLLNRIFSAFDQLTDKYELEKIKTIGDAYMLVSGLPVPRDDHLECLVEMALEMQAVMEHLRWNGLCQFELRIGINTGPVIAGIIGYKKFSYDLWGDTVNVASRMESCGLPGRIQVTGKVYERLKDRYRFRKRGPLR